MARKGPPPTPTKLRVLRGNPGKRSLPKNEPQPEVATPDPPTWLDGEGLVEWRRITPELEKLGLLSRIDLAALVLYCQAWGELAEASLPSGLDDFDDETDPFAKADALAKVAAVRRKAREQVAKFIPFFGLSPADRTKVHAKPQENETESPLEKLRRPIRG